VGGRGDHRPLKILHIDPERNWGGGEAQVLGLLTYLTANGHHCQLLAHPEGLLFARCRSLNIETQPIVMRNDLDVRCVPRLRRLIGEISYDIVHFHTKRAHTLALWLPRGKRRPKYVVTRRMDYAEPRGWYTSLLYNRCVDGVVAISQTIAKVLASAGVNTEKIRVICSGIDPRVFETSGRQRADFNNPIVVGCLGGLEERKGHRYLLEAAALLRAQGLKIRCKIGGDGPLRAGLEAEVERLDLGDEVHFMGFVTNTAQFLATTDVFAMPSLYEGLGVAVLEAMAAGKAVVATEVGGLTESVVDGVTGLLVQPRDPAGLASAIARLARSYSLAEGMGKHGRERVRRQFSLENMASQNESYYYELLASAS
jgi:glycosyltransferase involved in cell wall biosynthesis